ncbi:hypothetical protein [Streptomyces phytophilus]|nr:hypothetical protein [Streptomyces phytophilus]
MPMDVYAVEKAAQERRLAALEQAREADENRSTATRAGGSSVPSAGL